MKEEKKKKGEEQFGDLRAKTFRSKNEKKNVKKQFRGEKKTLGKGEGGRKGRHEKRVVD